MLTISCTDRQIDKANLKYRLEMFLYFRKATSLNP